MANFANGEFCSEMQVPNCVLLEREIGELIHLAGLKIDEDVTRHIISLLRYGVRPMSIFTMLQNLAKECKDPMKGAKKELDPLTKMAKESSMVTENGGNSYQSNKAKQLKAKTVKK